MAHWVLELISTVDEIKARLLKWESLHEDEATPYELSPEDKAELARLAKLARRRARARQLRWDSRKKVKSG